MHRLGDDENYEALCDSPNEGTTFDRDLQQAICIVYNNLKWYAHVFLCVPLFGVIYIYKQILQAKSSIILDTYVTSNRGQTCIKMT